MARRRTVPNPEPFTMLMVLAIGGAAFAGWEFVVKPELARKKTEEDLLNAAKKKGGALDDALKSLGKAGCQAYAASNGMKPDQTSGLCGALSALGVAGLKYGAKGAKVLGKDIGKGAKVVGKDIGKGAKATAKAVESVASHLKFWGLEGLHA